MILTPWPNIPRLPAGRDESGGEGMEWGMGSWRGGVNLRGEVHTAGSVLPWDGCPRDSLVVWHLSGGGVRAMVCVAVGFLEGWHFRPGWAPPTLQRGLFCGPDHHRLPTEPEIARPCHHGLMGASGGPSGSSKVMGGAVSGAEYSLPRDRLVRAGET
jgi:hypothetical protein